MIVNNIDNLECTLTGIGTSHCVNSILVFLSLLSEAVGNEVSQPPLKKKCKRSLPSDIVIREIPEYHGRKRVGPGELPYVQNLGLIRSSYDDKAKKDRMLYLVWVEVMKLKTHPLLLVPGWTGFNIKVRDKMVVLESAIGYLDTFTLGARDFSSVDSSFSQVFIVTRAKSLWTRAPFLS